MGVCRHHLLLEALTVSLAESRRRGGRNRHITTVTRRHLLQVLIFSQMVRMLAILEEYCHARRYPVERLDGGVTGALPPPAARPLLRAPPRSTAGSTVTVTRV